MDFYPRPIQIANNIIYFSNVILCFQKGNDIIRSFLKEIDYNNNSIIISTATNGYIRLFINEISEIVTINGREILLKHVINNYRKEL